MAPAEGLNAVPEKTLTLPGKLKFARLNTLKASARNSNPTLFPRDVVLNTDTSTSPKFGPTSALFPTFPNVPTASRLKALGLNHWFGVPSMTGPVKAAFQFGRSGFPVFPSQDRLLPVRGPNGKPLSTVTIELTCHPVSTLSQTPVTPPKKALFFPNGNSKPPLKAVGSLFLSVGMVGCN